MDVLKELESLKARHYYCEDCWYSCPLAEGGSCDDRKPKDECNCGAEDQHKRIDALIEYLSNDKGKRLRGSLRNPR